MDPTQQDERTEEHLDFLAEFVSLKSISSDPQYRQTSHDTASYLLQQILTLGADAEVILQDDANPAVIGKIGNEEDIKTILIYGHYDVQPASKEDGWDTDPFDLTEKDGFLYGRGATDDKGPISSTLFAVKEMMEDGEFPVNLRFIYEGMEESGSVGFEEIVAANLEFFGKVDGVVVIDNYWLGTERPCLTYGLRGMAYMGIEVSGPKQDLHSGVEGGTIREPMTDLINIMGKLQMIDGMPLIGHFGDNVRPMTPEENALYEDIDFDLDTYKENLGVTALNETDTKKLLMKKWRFPTFSFHGIEGAFSGPGGKTVIPQKVTAKVSMRLVPDQVPDEI
ncbi:MAG: M20/M25/M40 family metallo-hydrolase, partial [Candidatus Kariarchaeaceae archaeon]